MPTGRPRSPSSKPPTTPSPFRSRPAVAALASALLPGAGQWLQGRRRQAAPLLVLSAVALVSAGGAIWVLARQGPVYILEVAMRPEVLATLFVINALFLLVRGWAAADAYQRGTGGRSRLGAAAGVAVVALVVLPHVVVGAEAAEAHQMVTTMFQHPVRAPNAEAPTTTWRPGSRLTVLFLGAERLPTGGTKARGAVVVTVFPGDDRVAAVTLPANLTGIPVPAGADESAGDGSLTDLYRYGSRHQRLYPGAPDPGVAMVKDGVQSLLGVPVHHAVVFDSSRLDGMDVVGSAPKHCAGAAVVRTVRPSGLVRRMPSLVAELGDYVTSDIPLDLVPEMVELLPNLSPRQVVTVPITAPDYGWVEAASQVADPERVRAAMVSLVKLSPEEAAARLGLGDPGRCATGQAAQAAPDNR